MSPIWRVSGTFFPAVAFSAGHLWLDGPVLHSIGRLPVNEPNPSDPASAVFRLQSGGMNTAVPMHVLSPGDRVTSDDRLLADRRTLPLSRWQFSRIRSRCLRRTAWGAVSVVIGLLVLVWALLASTPALNHAGISADSPWRAIPVVVLMVYLLAGAGGIVWLMRHPLLRCLECKQSLAEGMAPLIAIVAGRCPKCAARLFEDDAALAADESAKGTGAKLLSRAELTAAERAAWRTAMPRTIKWGLSGGLLMALGGLSATLPKGVLRFASVKSGRRLCCRSYLLRELRLGSGRLSYGIEFRASRGFVLIVLPRLHRKVLPPSRETALDAVGRL